MDDFEHPTVRRLRRVRPRPTPDFRFRFHGSVWSIEAVSDRAKSFADEHFVDVQPWMGTRHSFATDWRVARDLREALIIEEDFEVESL